MRRQKFIIEDWAGNICFNGRKFKTFEDAWGFLYDFYRDLPDHEFDEQMGEYYVEEVA